LPFFFFSNSQYLDVYYDNSYKGPTSPTKIKAEFVTVDMTEPLPPIPTLPPMAEIDM